ncbi:LysR family transcriptional regulator [Kineosporia mesophila]|uniref:LysR family transcriptional regulator n=1 Tax=Kineosporia mesophila TaxID=566012 RepID=UPI001E3FB337|nr:LysR family transcriptional regulator [Kineosporia mesophila]
MQELDLLDAFMRVFQRGSMTAAAADLGVSQPALTDRISRLEARLGVRLFERSRRGTRPTVHAERLATSVGEPLSRLREVMRPPSEPAPVSGLLRLGGPAELMALRVLPALAPLLGAGLRVDIRLGQAHELLAALAPTVPPVSVRASVTSPTLAAPVAAGPAVGAAGSSPGTAPVVSSPVAEPATTSSGPVHRLSPMASSFPERSASGLAPAPIPSPAGPGSELDLVISAVRPKLPGITAVPLVDEEFVLVGTASHARSIDPAELANDPVAALAHLPLVAYGVDLPIVRRYWLTLFGRRPPNRVALTVPDLRAVLAAVTAGTGISVLPRYIACPALEAASVQVLHRGEELPLNTVYLACRTGEELSQPLGAVRERLLRAAGDWGTL